MTGRIIAAIIIMVAALGAMVQCRVGRNNESFLEKHRGRYLQSLATMIGTEASPMLPKKSPTKPKRNNGTVVSTTPPNSTSHRNFSIRANNNTSNATVESPSKSVKAPNHDKRSQRLDTRKFYIYDLPKVFWWRWPINSSTINEQCRSHGYLGMEHAQYSGIGTPIIPEEGLFLTWHFSMFSSLFNRLKRSSRRTKDPSKASLFIIPYDIGLDGYLNPNNCANRRSCSNGMITNLKKILSSMPYFARNDGADHVVLWSLGQYHPWPHAGCDLFMRDYCAKCTITCYWMDPTRPENKFVSLPFPASYHWWDGIQRLPWDTSPEAIAQRNLSVVYLGSTLTLNPTHTKIRRAMAAQCNASSDCHWLKIAHSSIDNKIGDLLSIYKRAVFCLCPPGDDPARKAVFDAIVSGCIPVIFEVATLYNQYPWHIGEQAALDTSVYIPGGLVRSGKINLMSVLRSITPEVIRKKQLAIAELAPRVQFAIPPWQWLKNISDDTVWDPPFDDAAELALNGFFERTSRVVRNESTHIPHRLMTGREWASEYEIVRIQVPRGSLRFGEEVNAKKGGLAEASSAANSDKDTTRSITPAGNSNSPNEVPTRQGKAGTRHGKGKGGFRADGGRGVGHHRPPSMGAPGEEENNK